MEVCIDSVQSAINAQNGGAKRIELCSNLLEGGTTPSIGLLKIVKARVSLPVFVMVRPRGGDFLYSSEEFDVMVEDIKQFKSAGADGVVYGILTKNGEVDESRCQKLLDQMIKPLPATFHRAFDMVRDQRVALETIIKLGFDRVLTSGGEKSVTQGASLLKELVLQAGNRILVMPGGGINENNLAEVLKETGTIEFHGSARSRVDSQMEYHNDRVSIGGTDEEYGRMITNVERIKCLVNIASDVGIK